jgi:hypothetical protein
MEFTNIICPLLLAIYALNIYLNEYILLLIFILLFLKLLLYEFYFYWLKEL